MQRWSYSANPLPQFRYGNVHLVEMPWWLWLIDEFADRSCKYVPPIPFPDWPKMHFDSSDKEYVGTPKTWYGDLRQMYCAHVCHTLFNWVWRHPKRKEYTFDVGYDKLKEVLNEHAPNFFKELDSDVEVS